MKVKTFLLGFLIWLYTALVLWPIYLFVVAMFLGMRIFGFIKISWPERIPHVGETIVLISNHKTMLEVFLMPAILWQTCWLRLLLGRGPMIVVDRLNFYNDRWFWLFRPFFIPVDRDRKDDKSILRIKRAIDQGRLIIYFYEGGRTYKGRRFLYSPLLCKRIREPKDAIGLLVSRTGVKVQPFWISGRGMPNVPGKLFNVRGLVRNILRFRMNMKIKVGKFMCIPVGMNKTQITQVVTQAHLSLADE